MGADLNFLKVDEFAKRLSITNETVYDWIKIKKIAALAIGEGKRKTWRIPDTEITRLREQCYLNDNF